jgi:ATP-dependent Lon protease
MTTVLFPEENRKDVKEIPKKVREAIRLVPVEFVDDVIREALVLEKPDEFFRPLVKVEPPVEPSPTVS